MSRIVITGMGIISAIGNNVAENRTALANGICGISKLELFPSKYADVLPFGEIKAIDDTLRSKLGVNEAGVTRTTLLALHAFEEAIKDGQLMPEQLALPDTALIGGSTVGGMCLTDELYADAHRLQGGSEYLSSYDCSSVFIHLQRRYGIGGIINTLNTACSSSANAIMYGARLIKSGQARRAVVGGTDSLAKFTINGFNALHLLAPNKCTPFDEKRNGLNLGEGAAFLVLEREEDVTGKRIYASLSGYCNTTDAFHPSSLSDEGEGPYLAMEGALKSAGISCGEISYINTHGTATENNDEAESRAMIRLFNEVPPFTSTKSNVGHTLGAAGAIEALYSILNISEQEVYPALNFRQSIPTTKLQPVLEFRRMPVNHVMSNSFGFGGNCTSLIFSKP